MLKHIITKLNSKLYVIRYKRPMQLGFLKLENTFRVTDNRCNPLFG